MKKLRDLKKEHGDLLSRVRELNKAEETRDLDSGERKELETLFGKAAALKKTIEDRERIKELELSDADHIIPEKERRDYKLRNVLSALSGKQLTGYEAEVHSELERRGHRTQHAGGILIPPDDLFRIRRKEKRVVNAQSALVSSPIKPSEYVNALYEASIMDRLGIRRITANGKFTFPTSSGVDGAGWFDGTGTGSISEDDPTYSSTTVEPHYLGVLSGWSLKQIKDMAGDISLESLLREDLAAGMAEKLDADLMKSDGTSNAPKGLEHSLRGLTPDRETDIDHSGANPAWTLANLLDEVERLKTAYKNNAMMPKWAINPAIEKAWQSTKKFTAAASDAVLAEGGLAVGIPYVVTNHLVPASPATNDGDTEIILGDFSEFIVCTFGAVELTLGMIDDDFKKGIQRIRAIGCFDFAMRRDSAFRSIRVDRKA